MKILSLLVLFQTAFAQPGFGKAYLNGTTFCNRWSCINRKLGLSDTLPTSEQFGTVLRRLLPSDWLGLAENVLQTCYNNRPRSYSDSCPGQAIMHCAIDQLVANCPDAYQRREDACSPIYSSATWDKMFMQGRVENVIGTFMMADEGLINYFYCKCCNPPALFNSTTLAECGFASMMHYL